MIHTLPAPVRGATHVEIVETAINVRHKFCILRGVIGTDAGDGVTLSTALPQWEHAIVLQDALWAEFRETVADTALLTLASLIIFVDQHPELWG